MKWTRMLSAALLAAGLHPITTQAAAPSTPEGLITGSAYLNVSGTAVANLTNNAKFPNIPDAMFFFPYFEWNAGGDISVPAAQFGNDYGARISGYFYPPGTGDYIFWIASDDNSSLFLSTDANPANKKLIARETVWSNAREYMISGGNSDLTAKDSSQFTATEWPTKDPGTGLAKITLQANQPVYIEAIMKEGGGGDYLSVSVADPGGTIDFNSPIPGQFLSTDRTAGAVNIVRQPASMTTGERGSASFSVLADGTPPYSFQWRKNGSDILDATNMTLNVSGLTVADNNAKYSVVVTGGQGTVTSQDATLTVTADTELPRVSTAKGSPNLTEVTLTFSEPIDPVSAAVIANYPITSSSGPLNVTAATVSPSGTQVTLTTAPQTLGTKYTLLVSGVKDTAAVPNTIAPSSKVVFFPTGKLVESNGFIVIEAENWDRNTDNIWIRNTARGIPSGGASAVAPNGAGGNTGSQLQYDVEFAQAATYQVWIRASGDNGNDDSVWFYIDGDGDTIPELPFERSSGNQASMTGFQPQADFVWRSDSQDGPDPFTVDVPAPGPRVIALARREDGSFVDKILLTTDTTFTPTGFGPPETRQGAPGLPTATLTAPANGATFTAGGNITLSGTGTGQSGLLIERVEYHANGNLVGSSSVAPFSLVWTNVPEGLYSITATAYDEIGQSAMSTSSVITVGASTKTKIAWVSFHTADNTPSAAAATAGFTEAPDVGYTRRLTEAGYDVTRVRTTGTPDARLLNAYDLVIVGRSVPSGDYETAAEATAWNSLTKPMMILGGYIIRMNRLGLATGNTIPDTIEPIKLQVAKPTHPIFEGISLDANGLMVNDYAGIATFNGTTERGISVVTDPMVDGADVLATVNPAGTPADGTIIAEFPAGTTLANGAANKITAPRLLFLSGSREHSGLTSEGAGIYDLTADGTKMFLNAVKYLTGGTGPEAPALSVKKTATGATITYDGTLQSTDTLDNRNWQNVQGATSPFNVTADRPTRFYRATR